MLYPNNPYTHQLHIAVWAKREIQSLNSFRMKALSSLSETQIPGFPEFTQKYVILLL